MELVATIGTVHQPGKHSHVSHLCWAASALTSLLYQIPCFLVYQRHMGILKDSLFFFGITNHLFALIGLFRCFEVIGIPKVVLLLQNIPHAI